MTNGMITIQFQNKEELVAEIKPLHEDITVRDVTIQWCKSHKLKIGTNSDFYKGGVSV